MKAVADFAIDPTFVSVMASGFMILMWSQLARVSNVTENMR